MAVLPLNSMRTNRERFWQRVQSLGLDGRNGWQLETEILYPAFTIPKPLLDISYGYRSAQQLLARQDYTTLNRTARPEVLFCISSPTASDRYQLLGDNMRFGKCIILSAIVIAMAASASSPATAGAIQTFTFSGTETINQYVNPGSSPLSLPDIGNPTLPPGPTTLIGITSAQFHIAMPPKFPQSGVGPIYAFYPGQTIILDPLFSFLNSKTPTPSSAENIPDYYYTLDASQLLDMFNLFSSGMPFTSTFSVSGIGDPNGLFSNWPDDGTLYLGEIDYQITGQVFNAPEPPSAATFAACLILLTLLGKRRVRRNSDT